MAEKSNGFWGGFWLGAIVGGIASAVVISRLTAVEDESQLADAKASESNSDLNGEDLARRNLEQKIAQLNAAIDAVSQEINQGDHLSSAIATPVEEA